MSPSNVNKKGRKQNTSQLKSSAKNAKAEILQTHQNAFYQRTGIAANQ
jgi:hypothetical protein